jgi:uncharacterized circularly permuted ATP-grasp superfamily protein/uncharacterized alpha-E superfamily protein
MDAAARRLNRSAERLLAAYRPTPGRYDELMGPDGRPRDHWRPVIDALADLGSTEATRRFGIAERHLRDSGVFYRVYDDPEGSERTWPLSPVPLVIGETEWTALARGLVQRAELMERLLGDVFGPAQLVAEGALPAAVITGNPEYLRPLTGVVPASGRHIHFYAAEIARGRDGRWWVLGDRAQAPSGAGYAVENRLAMTRALPDLFRSLNVERLASFFQAARAALAASASREDPRIAVLTPGPLNQTYFEHAYLARYLGFTLLEGGDLTVRDGIVYVRTIAGLKRLDVMLRRLDADYADPLELNAASQLGVPGLVQAVRAGAIVIANALGSGLVESRALMAFWPVLCRRLMGEDLLIPNMATWWCGEPAVRQQALERADELVFASAFPGVRCPALPNGPRAWRDMSGAEREALRTHLERRGMDVVAQEEPPLSTLPVWRDGKLEPRPFALRVFVARGPQGWAVMPGGFCRVSERDDVRAVVMDQGTRSADVWVVCDRPVTRVSLLPSADTAVIRRTTGSLPSRAADNLFWLGRYLERVEQTLRLVQALAIREADPDTTTGAAAARRRISELLFVWGAAGTAADATTAAQAARQALHGTDWGASAPALAAAVRRTASVIRDRLAPDAWRAIEDLHARLDRRDPKALNEADVLDGAQQALRTVSAISGLIEDNMNRMAGWRFIKLGRRIERGLATCRYARHFADPNAPPECLDVLLELTDSQITYRGRYVMGAARLPILDLVILDPSNPRSVAYQANSTVHHVDALPRMSSDGLPEPAQRVAKKLDADISTLTARDIDRGRLLGFEQVFMMLSDEVSAAYIDQAGPVERRRGSFA